MNKKKVKVLLIMLAVTFIASVLFLLIDRKPIGPCNTTVGWAAVNGYFQKKFGFNKLYYFLTQALGYLALLVCVGFATIGGLQLVTKKSLAKVDRNILVLGGLYAVTIVLYVLFDKLALNYRPVLIGKETFPEASFPSSHAMLAIVVFVSAPTILRRYIRNKGSMTAIRFAFYLLTAITVVGRLLSGVHWFTDIIASILISVTLLYAFYLAIDYFKPKKKATK